MLSCNPIPYSRALLYMTLSLSILCSLGVATSLPSQNITIEVPNGTTNHGEPNSFCTPATWVDIASFLLFNYFAHGATVISYPGEQAGDTFYAVVSAVIAPTFGVIRALNFIIRHPLLTAKNDLEVAARSGALCMLVRSSTWQPQKGDNIRNALIQDPGIEPSLRGCNTSHSDPGTKISPTTVASSVYTPPWLNDRTHFSPTIDTDLDDLDEIESRVVFGFSEPPAQYRFAFVPRNTVVVGLANHNPIPVSTPKLSSSFNLVKGIAALLQLLYTSSTLYNTNGSQVNRYGFAAPGLTVLPYAVMSALNLMANLVVPHYPTLYLVRSEVMEEAERRTGLPFNYVVGKVVDESDTDNDVMEGWSEIEGSFKDDEKVLHITRSAEEGEKIEICDCSSQRIYVPACPRFRRTDDTQTSPLRQFDETHLDGLVFPRYITRNQQALMQSSSISFSQLSSQLPQRPERSKKSSRVSDTYDMCLITFVIVAEFFTILALSNFSGRQSTLAQRAWIVTWLFTDFLYSAMMYLVEDIILGSRIKDLPSVKSSSFLQFVNGIYGLSYTAPPIGGFVVVSQILKAYGICYKFV